MMFEYPFDNPWIGIGIGILFILGFFIRHLIIYENLLSLFSTKPETSELRHEHENK